MLTTGAVQKVPKSQKNRFVNWPYELQEAIYNRENDFLHSPSDGTPEEAQRVVDSIDIPATPSDPHNYFVQTELNMLRRCLGLDLLPLKFVEQAYSQEL